MGSGLYWERRKCDKRRVHSQRQPTLVAYRGGWIIGWRCNRYLSCAQDKRVIRGEVTRGMHGCVRRRQRHRSGKTWRIY